MGLMFRGATIAGLGAAALLAAWSCGGDSDNPACPGGICFSGAAVGGGSASSNAGGSSNDGGASVGNSTASFDPVGSGGANSSSNGNGGSGGDCGTVEVAFTPVIPTVVLLIDQSGSMNANFNGQGERWDVVYDALMNPTEGVVQQLQDIVRFGLALYTYTSGPTCPEIVDVSPPALNNHATIDAVYSQEDHLSNTPTGDSLAVVHAQLAAFQEEGPKLIILATDGDPDRCDDPNGHDQISMDLATDAAAAAFADGIETVIIAVGNDVSDAHQQDMANAGSGRPLGQHPCDPIAEPATCAQTYEPASKAELVSAFIDIILGQRECVFELDGEVIDGKECDGEVMLNGQLIPCNDPDGWQLNSPTEIEFVGEACDTIKTELQVDVSASFPCDSIVGPPE